MRLLIEEIRGCKECVHYSNPHKRPAISAEACMLENEIIEISTRVGFPYFCKLPKVEHKRLIMVELTECDECPHCDNSDSEFFGRCVHKAVGELVACGSGVPFWCPLPKVDPNPEK